MNRKYRILHRLERGVVYDRLNEKDQQMVLYLAGKQLCHAAFDEKDGLYRIKPPGQIELDTWRDERRDTIIALAVSIVAVCLSAASLILSIFSFL